MWLLEMLAKAVGWLLVALLWILVFVMFPITVVILAVKLAIAGWENPIYGLVGLAAVVGLMLYGRRDSYGVRAWVDD